MSRYQMILMSNKIVPEPVERPGWLSGYQKVLMSSEICLGTAGGQ